MVEVSEYVHELTPLEEACGVTLAQVAEVLPKVLVRNGRVYLPAYTPPALASSVARCALGKPAVFVGIVRATKYPIYAAESHESATGFGGVSES